MERLSFTSKTGYNAIEASIHLARYLLAAPYVNGRRVLDVACGEGYGAFALKQFGAKSVEAIDISPAAIKVARTLFAAKNITYHVHNAEHVDSLFPKATFDVIVSLETVEHVRNPERFLRAVKAVAKRNAVIIISCPNDHWYYKDDTQSNPFHMRKYSFEQFRELTTSVFGGDGTWGYGVPVVGFGNIRDDLSAGRDPIAAQAAMLDFRRQASAVALPPRAFANVGPRNCSYFIGIWGGDGENIYTAAFAPISMDQYSNLASWEIVNRSPAQIDTLEQENAALRTAQERCEALLNDEREHCKAAFEKAQSTQAKLDEAMRSIETRDREFSRLSEQIGSLETAAQQEVGTLKNDLDEARDGLNQMKREVEHHRIQALALAKELEVRNRRVGELEGERDRFQGEVESWQSAEKVVRQDLADLSRSLEQIRPRLNRLENESAGYRIQALALGKELEVSNHHVGELTGERDRLFAELQTCRTTEAALRQDIIMHNKEREESPTHSDRVPSGTHSRGAGECGPRALEHGAHQGAEEATTTETFRIQALALSKELTIATSKIDELVRERAHLIADPSLAIASLLKEKKALEWHLNTVMKVSNGPTRRIRARVSAAVKSRLRRVARRIRPYLPRRLLFAAQAVARSVGM